MHAEFSLEPVQSIGGRSQVGAAIRDLLRRDLAGGLVPHLPWTWRCSQRASNIAHADTAAPARRVADVFAEQR
jgi:hypothetical protein